MSLPIDWELLGYVKGLFPFSADRIQSISREDSKLFIATDDDRRFILKLVEIGPVMEKFNNNIGEHQTLFYINPETKEPVFRNQRKKLFMLLWLLMCRIKLFIKDRLISAACVISGT